MKKQSIHRNQVGLASFVVVFILMIMISLVTLGFAKIIRREQVQTLDRQLSARAFYAAESGVNLAQENLSKYTTPKINCGTDTNITDLSVDATNNTSITCLTIDPGPDNIIATVGNQQSSVFPLTTSGAGDFTFSWQNATSPSPSGCQGGVPPNKYFLSPAAWALGGCGETMLRIDLVDVSNLAALDSNMMTFFAYPTRGVAGSFPFSLGAQTSPLRSRCVTSGVPKDCSITITGVPATTYVRLTSFYGTSSVEISTSVAGGIIGAQAEIDSTGKAQDVIRRIKVRVPKTGASANTAIPFGALDAGSGGICKKLLSPSDSSQPVTVDPNTPALPAPGNQCDP